MRIHADTCWEGVRYKGASRCKGCECKGNAVRVPGEPWGPRWSKGGKRRLLELELIREVRGGRPCRALGWGGGHWEDFGSCLNFAGTSADLGTGETQLICSEQNTLQGAGCILGAQGGGCSAARQAEMEAWMEQDGAGQILLYSAGGHSALLMRS